MKKLLLLFSVLFSYITYAQVDVYWRNEAGNALWLSGSSCDGGNDGNWYYGGGWGGNRRKPDCYAYHYIHFDNNNQTVMTLNGYDDFSVNKIFFEPSASAGRSFNSDTGRKIFFKGSNPKLENHSAAVQTFNVEISIDANTEINPIDGNISCNSYINTFGYTLNIWGNNGKYLDINGIITGSGNLSINQNTNVILSGSSIYTGSTTVNAGMLQLNNNNGALPSASGITVQGPGVLKVSKNQTLAWLTINSGATLVVESGATLTITGSLSNNGTIINNGTLVLQPSGAFSFPGTGSTMSAMKTLVVNGGSVALNKNINPENLTVSAGSLDLGSFTANNSAGSGTLMLSGSGTLKIGSTNTLPSGYTAYSFSSNSTVAYYGLAQTIATLGNNQKYGNLTLSGTGQKTLSGNVSAAGNLTLQTGTSLLVSTGKTLTVDNQVINNAAASAFVIEDNAALVQTNNVTNTGQMEQHKLSNNLYRLDYTMWSSPVAGQNLETFSPATAANRFYEYKYANNGTNWIEGYWSVNAAETNFAPAKGYLIRMPNSITEIANYNAGTTATPFSGVFTGAPNNGDISILLSTAHNRFTAVGNPYPSPINVTDFFTENSSVLDQAGAIYLWRKKNGATTSSYALLTKAAYTANGSGQNSTNGTGGQNAAAYYSGPADEWVIAPGQGFIVQTKAGAPANPSLSFKNSMRRAVPAAGQAFLRQGTQQAARFWLNLTNENDGFSQMAVAYLSEATTGLDYGYDGKKLTDDKSMALYTLAAETALGVQARPEFTTIDTVPMGFNAAVPGQYIISIDHTEGIFSNGQHIYLRDNTEGIVRDLTTALYTFTTEAGTFNDRFEIIYAPTVTMNIENTTKPASVMIYENNGNINITCSDAIIETVTVFDIRGSRLYHTTGINDNKTTISSLIAAHQVLIIETQTDKGSISKKIVH